MPNLKTALAAIPAVALAAPVLACGPADVCADVINSLGGSVIVGTFAPAPARVELAWSTDQERPGTLTGYRISRCGSPTDCTPLAFVMPSGSCGSLQQYGYIDQPPGPVDVWFYRVELMTRSNAVTCPVDVVPE